MNLSGTFFDIMTKATTHRWGYTSLQRPRPPHLPTHQAVGLFVMKLLFHWIKLQRAFQTHADLTGQTGDRRAVTDLDITYRSASRLDAIQKVSSMVVTMI